MSFGYVSEQPLPAGSDFPSLFPHCTTPALIGTLNFHPLLSTANATTCPFTASIPSDFHASAYRSGNMTFLNITTNDGVLEFLYEVDQSFLADDKILVRQLSDPVFEAPLPAGPLVLQPILGLAFCEKNPVIGNWSRLYHDPTLSVLFNPDPTTPLTPHQKSNRDLAIGLSIGLIALALIIIATIVILVWKVPKVKTFFNPYSARKGAVGSSNLK